MQRDLAECPISDNYCRVHCVPITAVRTLCQQSVVCVWLGQWALSPCSPFPWEQQGSAPVLAASDQSMGTCESTGRVHHHTDSVPLILC